MSAAFHPHAIILTERSIPQPIFPVALAGGPERFLMIEFDPGSERDSFASQVLRKLADKLSKAGDGTIPCFGRPIGFVINFSQDRAMVFDMKGKALEILPEPYRLGRTDVMVNGRSVPVRSIIPRD